MCPAPDPKKPEPDSELERLRIIFQRAAYDSTGPGKPKFQRLSKAYNAMQDSAETGSRIKFEMAKVEFDAAMTDVQRFAKTDPATEKTLLELSAAITAETERNKAAREKPPEPKTTPDPKPPADTGQNPPPPPPPRKKKQWKI